MKIAFVSNYYNHHQAPFCRSLSLLTNGEFYFIENEPLAEERKNMGWGEKSVPEYVKQAYINEEEKKKCCQIIDNADMVIFENTTRNLVQNRLENGKLSFLYSERCFKSGYEWWKFPVRWITWHQMFGKYKNNYLLCASAYTAADFTLTFNYLDKAYKWGYFPEVKQYNIDELMKKKTASIGEELLNKRPPLILWAGRLIEWKHPDVAIRVAAQLKKKGYSFRMNIIGNGEMEGCLHTMIQHNQLSDCVEMLGAMTPNDVRTYMEQADIYLFTSDFNEGWGAVLNEAMNSACAVVASHAIGSAPFLIEDKVNGMIYKNGNEGDLLAKVETLLLDAAIRMKLGKNAYKTMQETWNAEVAAERLLNLAQDLLRSGNSNRYKNGPCSKAGFLGNGWYKA